jgi:hypothetical protein
MSATFEIRKLAMMIYSLTHILILETDSLDSTPNTYHARHKGTSGAKVRTLEIHHMPVPFLSLATACTIPPHPAALPI